jgi:hypothetical protein
MTLPTSGPLSIEAIRNEFLGPRPGPIGLIGPLETFGAGGNVPSDTAGVFGQFPDVPPYSIQ